MANEPVVVIDSTITAPDGRRFWLSDDMFPVDSNGLPRPRFSVQEVAKVFFGKGPDWLRWRYHAPYVIGHTPLVDLQGNPLLNAKGKPRQTKIEDYRNFFTLDGEPLEPKTTEAGARYYTLADVEKMATALAQNEAIDGGTLAHVLTVVVNMSRLYGVALGETAPITWSPEDPE